MTRNVEALCFINKCQKEVFDEDWRKFYLPV